MTTDGFIYSSDNTTLIKCDFPQLGTRVEVPEGTVKIDNAVFAEALVLYIKLPDSVTTLGENVFSSCDTVKTIILSKSLTSLKPFTFSGCCSLQEIEIPSSITSYPEGLFLGCSSLENFEIKSKIETIEFDTFRDCEKLKEITLPDSVTKINSGAFCGCSSLETINFSKNLQSISDRSLAGLTSLKKMTISSENENFFIEETSGCLYQNSLDGVILIKCPSNITSVKLIENTCDVHIDAFDDCKSLMEVFVYENANEELVNKVIDLVPHLDVNSYGDEVEEPALVEGQSPVDGPSLLATEDSSTGDAETLEEQATIDEPSQLDAGSPTDDTTLIDEHATGDAETVEEQATIDEPSPHDADSTPSQIDIDAILNDQCCRNDALDEGFRPVTMDELERLMNPASTAISESTETVSTSKNAEQVASSDSTSSNVENNVSDIAVNENSTSDNVETSDVETEEKPKKKKRKYTRRTKKAKDEITTTDDSTKSDEVQTCDTTSEVATNEASDTTTEITTQEVNLTQEEPAFIKTLKNIAKHQLILEENDNQKDNVYGDLKDLFVFADDVSPSTNEFSSHLVKFAKEVASRCGFTKIYFFDSLPIDNPEFIYGVECFGSLRNVLYACNKDNSKNISLEQKELIKAAGILMPDTNFVNVKDTPIECNEEYPVKLLVSDNYVEGLLYCATKYRQSHGLDV